MDLEPIQFTVIDTIFTHYACILHYDFAFHNARVGGA